MLDKINTVAYDSFCNDDGEEDFLRSVPCDQGKLCPDEDNPENVVRDSQFTFRIQDLYQARFWYVSLVACRKNMSSCKWEFVKDFDDKVDYDINIVNGNPGARNRNVFKFHYSSDEQDLLPVYLMLLLVYTILTPLQVSLSSFSSF